MRKCHHGRRGCCSCTLRLLANHSTGLNDNAMSGLRVRVCERPAHFAPVCVQYTPSPQCRPHSTSSSSVSSGSRRADRNTAAPAAVSLSLLLAVEMNKRSAAVASSGSWSSDAQPPLLLKCFPLLIVPFVANDAALQRPCKQRVTTQKVDDTTP